MHVLDTDSAAVGIAKNAEDLTQSHETLATESTCCEFAIEIPEGEAVAGDFKI